jgi:hypothetical protein
MYSPLLLGLRLVFVATNATKWEVGAERDASKFGAGYYRRAGKALGGVAYMLKPFTGKNRLKSHPQRLGTCKSSTRKLFRADESHHCHLFAPQTVARREARVSHTRLFFEYSFLKHLKP